MYNTNSFYPSSQQMRQSNYLPQLKGRPVSSIDEQLKSYADYAINAKWQ